MWLMWLSQVSHLHFMYQLLNPISHYFTPLSALDSASSVFAHTSQVKFQSINLQHTNIQISTLLTSVEQFAIRTAA